MPLNRLLALMFLLVSVSVYHRGDELDSLVRYWLPAYVKRGLVSLGHWDSHVETEDDQRGNDGRERGRSTDI